MDEIEDLIDDIECVLYSGEKFLNKQLRESFMGKLEQWQRELERIEQVEEICNNLTAIPDPVIIAV